MEQGNSASPPYGPTANLKAIFDTWRDRSMPEQLGKEWLERIGLSAHLSTKNMHALRYLGLVDDLGFTTDVAQRLRTATSEEYPSVLEEIIRKSYRKVFEIRNPSIDSRTRIDDAFRHEQPQAQRSRMVACFLGLCALAGMPLKEAPPQRDGAARRANSPPVKRSRVETATTELPRKVSAADAPPVPQEAPPTRPIEYNTGLNPVLAGLLKSVPDLDTAEELEEWYLVFKAAFLFVKNMASKTKSESSIVA